MVIAINNLLTIFDRKHGFAARILFKRMKFTNIYILPPAEITLAAFSKIGSRFSMCSRTRLKIIKLYFCVANFHSCKISACIKVTFSELIFSFAFVNISAARSTAATRFALSTNQTVFFPVPQPISRQFSKSMLATFPVKLFLPNHVLD